MRRINKNVFINIENNSEFNHTYFDNDIKF